MEEEGRKIFRTWKEVFKTTAAWDPKHSLGLWN